MNNNYLYLADTLKVLERTESEIATLAFLDPPMLLNSFMKFNNTNEQSIIELSDYLSKVFQQVKRILKKDGILCLYHIPKSPINFRLILDQIFERNCIEEIKIKHIFLGNTKSLSQQYDNLILYSNSDSYHLNKITRPLNIEELKRYNRSDQVGKYTQVSLMTGVINNYRFEWMGITPEGNRYWRYRKEKLDELLKEDRIDTSSKVPTLKYYVKEKELGTDWSDISTRVPPKERQDKENYSFGQKPLQLMERIIHLASNEGDIILDPFVGTGSIIVAAQNNNRNWIGIDHSDAAIHITEARLSELGIREFIRADEYQLNETPIIFNTYKELVVQTKEIAELQANYLKLTGNLNRLKDLLKIEGASSEEILMRIEDWILNVNKLIEKTPEKLLLSVENHLKEYFGNYWTEELLEKNTKKYLKTSEIIFRNMEYTEYDEELDFSPAVITLTKAIEHEFYIKVYKKIIGYCISKYGTNQTGKRKWPSALTRNNNGVIELKIFTFGSINSVLFFNWNCGKDYKTIYQIVKELDLFKEDAEIFNTDKRKILKKQFTTLNDIRNSIAHKDHISINTAKECKEVILAQNDLFVKFLGMLKSY